MVRITVFLIKNDLSFESRTDIAITQLCLLLFSDLVKEFHTWLSGQKDIVRECADHSGDMSVVERKLQKLKVLLLS